MLLQERFQGSALLEPPPGGVSVLQPEGRPARRPVGAGVIS